MFVRTWRYKKDGTGILCEKQSELDYCESQGMKDTPDPKAWEIKEPHPKECEHKELQEKLEIPNETLRSARSNDENTNEHTSGRRENIRNNEGGSGREQRYYTKNRDNRKYGKRTY